MSTLTKKNLLEAIEDMPMDMPIKVVGTFARVCLRLYSNYRM